MIKKIYTEVIRKPAAKIFLISILTISCSLLYPGEASAQSCNGISNSECAALYAVYNSTGGDNWFDNDNWLTQYPVSDWGSGIVTVEYGHVVELNLTDNNLRGTIPPEIADLTELRVLSFWDNNLRGELPEEITDLTQLEYLDLSTNFLSGTIPEDIGNLVNLQELWLESNLFTGQIPASITDLENLSILSMYTNQLEGEIPDDVGDLENLLALYLDGNFLSGTIPAGIGSLPYLRRLYLGDNKLTGEIPASLWSMNTLQNLSLRNNLLTGQINLGMSLPENITALDLAENQLTGSIPSALGAMTGLKTLKLNGNSLSGEIPPSLGSLPFLEELSLHNNNLTGEIPLELGSLQNLIYLSLHSNELEGTIPAELGNIPSLYVLYLTNNNLTGEIPPNLGYSDYLLMAGFSDNQLEGTIPNSFSNLLYLRGLWASGNRMSGELPSFLSSPPESLDLRWNQLQSGDLNILNKVEAKHGNHFKDTQTLTPENFTARAAGDTGNENRIDLSWDPIDYTADGGYEILYKKEGEQDYTSIGLTSDKGVDSYTFPDLQPGADYRFKMRAVTLAHAGNSNILQSTDLETDPITSGTTSRAFIPVWKRALDKFTGIVVSNFGDTAFNVTLSAYDSSGNLENAVINPVVHNIPPDQQLSLLGNEFFGKISGSELSWVELSAENTNRMGSLFLYGVTDTSMLDGAETQTRYAKKLYFTRPLAEGLLDGYQPDIQLSVVNPFSEQLHVKFTLTCEAGSLASSSIAIPARGFITRTAEELFGASHGLSDAYMSIETTDGPGIVGFARTEIPGIRTALGLNAAEAVQERLLYSAQMASGEDIVTSIRLVNTSDSTRNLRLSAIAPDGSTIAPDTELKLGSQGVIERNFNELFDLPSGVMTVGSLEVEADGGGIIGDVIFADGDNLKYAMALPLQTRLFKEAVFNHVANLPGILFTGIALFNPGDETADIEITIFGLDGNPVAEGDFQLAAGERISRVLTDPDMWPDLPSQSGGYIKIQSSQPIVGQQLFGDATLRYMAAIPPSTRLEPMFD